MNSIRTIVAGVSLVIVVLFGVGTPTAQATASCTLGFCGELYHYSPDRGYDRATLIRCDWGNPSTNHLLREGQHSTRYCRDMDQIYVRRGEEIWCLSGNRFGPFWAKRFDATGWHKVTDLFSQSCVMKTD